MRCLPHTVHLIEIKLLEGIEAMSMVENKKVSVCSTNYQDNITVPLDCIYDNNTMANDKIDDKTDDTVDNIAATKDLDCDLDTADGV